MGGGGGGHFIILLFNRDIFALLTVFLYLTLQSQREFVRLIDKDRKKTVTSIPGLKLGMRQLVLACLYPPKIIEIIIIIIVIIIIICKLEITIMPELPSNESFLIVIIITSVRFVGWHRDTVSENQ